LAGNERGLTAVLWLPFYRFVMEIFCSNLYGTMIGSESLKEKFEK